VDALISPLEDPAGRSPPPDRCRADDVRAAAGGEALSATAPDAAPETAPAPDGPDGPAFAPPDVPARRLASRAAAFLTAAAVRHLRFYRKLARTSLPVEDAETLGQLDACRRALGLSRTPPWRPTRSCGRRCSRGSSVRARPARCALDADELRLIFRHELTHLKRRDIWLKLLSLISNAVHWFNPAAYALRRELGTFCELSCDERVVSGLDAPTRRFYGRTILGVMTRAASGGGLYTALAMSGAALKSASGASWTTGGPPGARRPSQRRSRSCSRSRASHLVPARRAATQTNELAVCIDSTSTPAAGRDGRLCLQNPA
jgi:hypothetical protein